MNTLEANVPTFQDDPLVGTDMQYDITCGWDGEAALIITLRCHLGSEAACRRALYTIWYRDAGGHEDLPFVVACTASFPETEDHEDEPPEDYGDCHCGHPECGAC